MEQKEQMEEFIKEIIQATDANDVETLTRLAQRVSLELLELLKEKNPMLIDMYLWRMEHLDQRWPNVMRIHNALEILYAYLRLKKYPND